jgi:hypothetical protein
MWASLLASEQAALLGLERAFTDTAQDRKPSMLLPAAMATLAARS